LHRKTCADFDEGGASGLLLNHLNLYDNGKIVFDASDMEAVAQINLAEQEELAIEETVDLSSLLGKVLIHDAIIDDRSILVR
jgi:condensin complex subunit 2